MALVRGLVAPLPMIGVVAGLLLLTAGLAGGVWVWPRAWVFLAVFAALGTGASALMAVLRPASFEVRRQGLIARPGARQPLVDAIGSVLYLGCLMAWLAFIPLDVFRLKLLPSPGPLAVACGVAATVAGVAISQLAIAQNRFAAPTIHEQADQRLIDTGLYALVRHPFYAGMLLLYAGVALWLGSYAALIVVAAFAALTLARIVIEEAHLRRVLPGYADYANRVRGRLIPFVL